MVKLWIFVDFRVKKKWELDELYFWITPIAFVGNARRNEFAESQYRRNRFHVGSGHSGDQLIIK